MTKEQILRNPKVKEKILKLNLTEEQINNNIYLFEQIIKEHKIFNYDVEIYDETSLVLVARPSKFLEHENNLKKYHRLSDITQINYSLSFSKEINSFDQNIEKDKFNWIKNREGLANWLQNFIKNPNRDKSKGFYLFGGLGTGKSSFMNALANFVLKNKKTFAYVELNNLFDRLKKSFNSVEESSSKIMEELMNVDYLFIDDIGNGKNTEWSLFSVLYPILDARVRSRKFISFTSNLSIEDLEKSFKSNKNLDLLKIDRLIDRIRCSTELIKLDGKNLRIKLAYENLEKKQMKETDKQLILESENK